MTSHVELYESGSKLYESQSTNFSMTQSELIQTYTKHKWVDDKDSSICIIGAGQAGIHMASLLLRSGFRNVVVIECNAQDSASGKLLSVPDEEYDVVHDLGSAYIHPNYSAFFHLLDVYGDRKTDLIEVDHSSSVIVNGNHCAGIAVKDWVNGKIQADKLTMTEMHIASTKSHKSSKKAPRALETKNHVTDTTDGSPQSSTSCLAGDRSATASTTQRPQTPLSPLPGCSESSPQSVSSMQSPLSPSPESGSPLGVTPQLGPIASPSPTLSSWMAPKEPATPSLTVSHAARRYIKLHGKIFGHYEDVSDGDVVTRFPPKPLKFQYINMTFLEFIKKYKLEILIPYFVYNQSLLEGFGNLDEIPAFYGMLWNNASSIMKLVDPKEAQKSWPAQKESNRLWMLKHGFHGLFQSIIEEEGIEIKYNAEIMSINRYLNDEKHKICVMYCQTVDNEEYEKLIECDALFCASNISELLPLFSDVTEEEEAAFSNISTHILCTTLMECDVAGGSAHRKQSSQTTGGSMETEDDETEIEDTEMDDEKEPLKEIKEMSCSRTPSDTPSLSIVNPSHLSEDADGHSSFGGHELFEDKGCVFYPDKLLNKDGHLFKLKNCSLLMNGEEHFARQRNKGLSRERLIGFQLLPKDDISYSADPRDLEMTLETILLDDLKRIGKRNVKLLEQNVMPFCPQWSQTDVNNGIPWLVKDELQGKNKNMYYIGSSVCFQSIESVLEYNNQLTRNVLYL